MVPEYQQRVIDERSALERKAKDLTSFIGYSPIFEELQWNYHQRNRTIR